MKEKGRKMKRIAIVLAGILLMTSVFAQPGEERGLRPNCQSKMTMNKLEVQEYRKEMMAYQLTERLELTPEQAEQFFPRFREHREEMKVIREDIIEVQNDIRGKIKDGDEISDAELDAVLNKMTALNTKKDKARNLFINSLDDVLDNEQIAKLALMPKQFGKNKMKRMSYNQRNHR